MNSDAAVLPEPAVRGSFVGEAEAYELILRSGLEPPRHAVIGKPLPFAAGEPVVLKGLGEELWHKSEAGAVEFMTFAVTPVITAAHMMARRVEDAGHRWIGALVCERIAVAHADGLPSEGFVSLARGEAGWVVLCGFGGLQADALAAAAPPLRWPLALVQPADALAELKAHLLGRIWLGRLRGTTPLTTEPQLAEFIEAVWRLAALAETDGINLLEMNPVVLDEIGQPRPVDAVGRRGAMPKRRLPPPGAFLPALRHPRRVALAGVSEKPGGVGRVILENLCRCPALAGAITLIKPSQAELLGLPCVPDVLALRAAPVDLLVLALPAPAAAAVLTALIGQGGGASVVALVSGGLGDGADVTGLGRQLEEQLQEARAAGRWTPTVLGPNFLGHWVPALQLDTSFIPAEKLTPPRSTGGDLVLLSQSGAFLLCRRSRALRLRFGLGVALGNQMDAALPDFLRALARESECGAVAAYVEGFGPGQLLATAKAAQRLHERGIPVLMHRAGRTPAGHAAAASHTGAMAGDWDLEQTLLQRAGVKLSASIAAFDAALEWLGTYPATPPGPVALVTNAGFESVNASDLLAQGLDAAVLTPAAKEELAALLVRHQLNTLVNPQLPLDLTPMASEDAFLAAVDLVLGSAALLIVGLVPFTRRLNTARPDAAPFAAALAKLAAKHGKPVAVAVDAGPDYDGYRSAFGEVGLAVFDRVESALLGLRTLR